MRVSPVQDTWDQGMRRDKPRDRMAPGSAWNLVDFMPGEDGALQKRAGWTYQSDDIATANSAASYVVAGAYAPFAAAGKNCAIDEDGRLYTIATNGTVTDIGAAVTPVGPLPFHRDKLIIPASDGTTAPKYYDGSTLGALAGSPPAGKYGCVYKDRTALACTAAQPNRVYFSGPGDPTSWDTTNGYVDGSFPVTAVASLRNALIVLSQQVTERIIGSTPPPGSDMAKQTLFDGGCVDARSAVVSDDQLVYANTESILVTDGATVLDLTEAAGCLPYWRSLMASYSSTYTLAAGAVRRHYVLSVMDGSSFVDCLMFDLRGRRWWRLSNVKARMFWNSVGAAPETYFGSRAAARVVDLTGLWSASGSTKNDADGTAVAPVLETMFYPIGLSKGRVRDVYLSYDMRDAATDNPTLTVSTVTDPASDAAYTAATGPTGTAYTAAETSETVRVRRSVRKGAFGFALKVAQTNASSVTRIRRVEATVASREDSRV